MKASRNKLSPKTAGQGVSESSLAGFLHTDREKGGREKQIKTHLPMLCQFGYSVCSLFSAECKTKNTPGRVCVCVLVCLPMYMNVAVHSTAKSFVYLFIFS